MRWRSQYWNSTRSISATGDWLDGRFPPTHLRTGLAHFLIRGNSAALLIIKHQDTYCDIELCDDTYDTCVRLDSTPKQRESCQWIVGIYHSPQHSLREPRTPSRKGRRSNTSPGSLVFSVSLLIRSLLECTQRSLPCGRAWERIILIFVRMRASYFD